MRVLRVVLIALLWCSGIGAAEASGQDITDPEAYAVYAKIFDDRWSMSGERPIDLVLQRETVTGYCVPSGGELESAWWSVRQSFLRANESPGSALPGYSLPVPYVVLSRESIRETFSVGRGGWEEYFSSYPNSGGYLAVSVVGFDYTRTRAMVYMEHHCGPLCGGGRYHFLRKVDGRWQETSVPLVRSCDWIS